MSWSWGIEAVTARSGSFPMTGAIFWASSDSGYEYNWIRCASMGWSIDQLAQLIFHTDPIGPYFPMNGTSMVLNMSPNPMDWRRWKCRQLHRDGPRGPNENQSQRWILIVQPTRFFFQCFPCLFHHKKNVFGFVSLYIPKQKYGYGSIPINTIFSGMNIHLPAILMFTRGTRFWHTAIWIYVYIYIYMYMNSLLSCSVVVSVLIPLSIFQPAGWCGLHRLTTNLSMSWTRRLVGSFAHSKSAKNLFMFSYRAAWRLQIASWPWFTSHQLLKEA